MAMDTGAVGRRRRLLGNIAPAVLRGCRTRTALDAQSIIPRSPERVSLRPAAQPERPASWRGRWQLGGRFQLTRVCRNAGERRDFDNDRNLYIPIYDAPNSARARSIISSIAVGLLVEVGPTGSRRHRRPERVSE